IRVTSQRSYLPSNNPSSRVAYDNSTYWPIGEPVRLSMAYSIRSSRSDTRWGVRRAGAGAERHRRDRARFYGDARCPRADPILAWGIASELARLGALRSEVFYLATLEPPGDAPSGSRAIDR